jgi:hypothetical protein
MSLTDLIDQHSPFDETPPVQLTPQQVEAYRMTFMDKADPITWILAWPWLPNRRRHFKRQINRLRAALS